MNIWNSGTITTKGIKLQAKLHSGATLSLTRAVAGAGTVDAAELISQTAVTDERQALSFSTKSYPEEGMCAVPLKLDNASISEGYTVTQIGIYAFDPDEGEILFMIAQAADGEGTHVPSNTEMPGYAALWTFYIQYGQADGLDITVDPEATASVDDVNTIVAEHTTRTDNPHNVTAAQLGLGNVDNTADNDKYVAYAQRAGEADKTQSALTIRVNGGRTEGTDMWTFDGSTGRAINLSYAKLGVAPAIESTAFPGCYYREVDGEEEWINPPMTPSVEYRTTERYGNQPVYAWFFSGITLLGLSENTITLPIGTDGTPFIIDAKGTLSDGRILPHITADNAVYMTVSGRNITIGLGSGTFKTEVYADVLCKYIKQ